MTSDGPEIVLSSVTDTSNLVPSTRKINTTAPLAGGGDLSADRTFSIDSAYLVENIKTGLPEYYFLPFGDAYAANAGGTGAQVDGTANRIRFQTFNLNVRILFSRILVNVTTTSAGNHLYFAIYDKSHTTLLGQWTITLGAGTGAYQATKDGGGSLQLTPGTYVLAWGSDVTTPVISGFGTDLAPYGNLINKNTIREGQSQAGVLIVAGVFPANLGTVVNASIRTPGVLLEVA